MKTARLIVVLFFAIPLFCQCGKQDRYAFPDISYLDSFDIEASIADENSNILDLDLEGITGFKIYGPYLLISSESEKGMITILESKYPYTKLGSFFTRGNGPGELIYPFPPSGFIYHTDPDGTIYADLDNHAGKFIRFNISESVKEGRTMTEVIGSTEKLTFGVVDLGEDGIFYKELSPERDAQTRFIVRDGQRIVTKNMEVLNRARIKNTIDDGSRFNVLSGNVLYNPQLKCFAETPGQINAIHFFALDDSYAKTICIGKKLYDYNEIADRDEYYRPRTSICTRQFDDYIAVLYLDINAIEFSTDDWRPALILFKWDLSRTCRVVLPNKVSSFDIDQQTMTLFAYDSYSETFYTYSLEGIKDFFK